MDLGESSTSFRIHCLEFYFPRHSVASPVLPLLSPFPTLSFFRSRYSSFFSPSQLTLSLPSRGSLRRASARFYPAFRDWRHLSWMDRQSSFASRPSAHLPPAASWHPFGSAYSPTRWEIMPRLNSRIHAKCARRADVRRVIVRG